MNTALVINGIFEDVLSEILSAQEKAPSKPHFLQPYSQGRITLLAKEPPSELSPRTLYLSLTNSLHEISYQAKIVRWQDKRKIGSAELAALNKEIAQFQPNEKEMVYVTGAGGRQYVNLISIVELKRLRDPISVSCFVKVNDGLPLKKKRPGGWSYVGEQPQWLGASSTSLLDDVTKELEARVRESRESTSAQRHARLAVAPHKPQEIQVLSRAYRRNSDVIIEVLLRADGQCEQCGSPAPFLRMSNESPYLEVHHKVPLALGGDDTVANATALCPNCHRQNHFGKAISQGTWHDPILVRG